ncbi:uncharacterized protein LOC128323207 [Hemicordylus capensis]|uniref:uncharacterized protein LOC128323207 n=1 Tax=Hemicordylus capensis TaxID=884348 RepID=UPI002303B340|nr:uncharacterized protein LOC128323207 [Hemicordylus capensis]
MLHHVLGDPLGEEPNEATLAPGPLPGLHVPTDILGKELNEETSMLGSLPEPRVPTDILEEELNEETLVPGSLPELHVPTDILEQELSEEMSVPRSLPEPCITNDILGEEPNEATLVPGLLPGLHVPTDILGKELNEATSVVMCTVRRSPDRHRRGAFDQSAHFCLDLPLGDLPQWPAVSPQEIKQLISKIKGVKAPGNDFIPPDLLKVHNDWQLSNFVTDIFPSHERFPPFLNSSVLFMSA